MTDKRAIGKNPWWLRDSIRESECLAAFQPIGALDRYQALDNINGRGTNNATWGVEPAYRINTGWYFDGSNSYLTVGSGPIATSVPLSMICLFNPTYNDTLYKLMSIARTTSQDNQFNLCAAGATDNDPVAAMSVSVGSEQTATTGVGFTYGQWCVGAAVFKSSTLRTAYIFTKDTKPTSYVRMGNKGIDTNDITVGVVLATYIGCSRDGSSGLLENRFSGWIGACAFYNVALRDRQVLEAALAMLELV